VLVVVGGLVSVAAVGYVVATPLPSERYTEFYVVGPNGSVEDIPADGTAPAEVTLGLVNHEHRPTTYGIQVQVREPGGGGTVVRTIEDVRINHGTTWRERLALPVPSQSDRLEVEVLLFRGSVPGVQTDPATAYRYTRVWVVRGCRADALLR
jgi:uncharacterized membrane protein